MRLSVIIAVGAILTGVALVMTRQLHPVASPATVASPSPQVSYSDPPWTVPLPTRTAAPTPTSVPSRKAAPKPRAADRTTQRSRRTVRTVETTPPTPRTTASTAPVIRRAPTMLGPPTDSSVETMLTTQCVRTRGALAVAALGKDGTWGCRHAEQTTPLDMTAACRRAYGTGAQSRRLDGNDPYSWRCFR